MAGNQPHQQLQQMPLHSGHAISQIFKFKKLGLGTGQKPPRLNETMPLTLYYHAGKSLKMNLRVSISFNFRSASFQMRRVSGKSGGYAQRSVSPTQ
jgi:hypothetical protein